MIHLVSTAFLGYLNSEHVFPLALAYNKWL